MRERMKALEAKVEGHERDWIGRKDAEKAQRERALDLNERAVLEKEAKLQAEARYANEQRAKEARAVAARREAIEKARRDKVTEDPISAAETALKQLRRNPGDKQAAEALEQALQRLKDQRPKEPENLQKR
jgi:hypothetical protein